MIRLTILLLACLIPAAAQSTFGTILGTATDKSGAAVPGAKITITNEGENVSRDVVSDGVGNYEVLNLKSGMYTVAAEAAGFRRFQQKGLLLDARQTIRVDVPFEVGQLAETVTVEGSAQVINTETQTITASFDNRNLLQLPANFRGSGNTSPLRILTFLPGVQSDDSTSSFSIQGALPHMTEVSLDGISTVSVRSNGPLVHMFPSVEGIAEMKVQGVGNNAEFGQVGDITTTSKGGSNAFHGSLFEYMQNRVFDAKSFGAVTKGQKSVNTFGGSLGGPILRNRTFFFVTSELMRFPLGLARQDTVPTERMRRGDFSLQPGALNDPLNNNMPFPNRQIPASQISPIATRILDFGYPTPNFGNPDVQASANFRENRPSPSESWQYDIRLDHVLSSKQSVFTRWSAKNYNLTATNSLKIPSQSNYNDSRSLVVSHNYTISPRHVNEFRIGISHNDAASSYAFDGPKIVEGFGFQGLGPFPYNGLTGITFSGATTNFGKGKAPFTFNRNFQFNDNFFWTAGRHTMKFGADFRRLRAASEVNFFGEDDYGRFQFTTAFSGNDFANFLLGLPTQSRLAKTGMDTDGKSYHYSFYAQDSFKVSRKLTLEYGLRWEYHPPFTDASSNITIFDRAVPRTGRVIIPSDETARKITSPGFLLSINACPSALTQGVALTGQPFMGVPCTPFITAKEAGYPEQLRFADKQNWNPRFGFAWRPFSDNKTVLRGGFGIYTMTILGSVFYSLTAVHGSDIRDFPNSITNNQPAFRWPQVSTGGSGVGTVAYGNAYFGTSNDPNFKDPYEVQWSLTAEREILPNLGLRVSYVGMRGVHLPISPDLNQPLESTTPFPQRSLLERPFPYWARIYSRDTGGNSIYNEMQTEINRRYRAGLTFTGAWTWAKSLSDAAGPAPGSFSAENGGGRQTNSRNRRLDRGDVHSARRHRGLVTTIYELPFGKGKHFMSSAHPVVDAILGGWRLSGILLLQTGPFITPTMTGGDPSGTGALQLGRGSQRPDALRSGNIEGPTPDRWFDRDAFICPGQTPGANQFNCNIPPIGRFGNAGVGILVGPGTVNMNFGFGKDFRITERVQLKFEGSFTNVANHPNFSDPNAQINSIAFGRTTTTRGGAESGGNRVGQFGLRLEF